MRISSWSRKAFVPRSTPIPAAGDKERDVVVPENSASGWDEGFAIPVAGPGEMEPTARGTGWMSEFLAKGIASGIAADTPTSKSTKSTLVAKTAEPALLAFA
jgi:hypothetical protein